MCLASLAALCGSVLLFSWGQLLQLTSQLKCPGMSHKEAHLKTTTGGTNIKERLAGSLQNKEEYNTVGNQ